MPWRIYDPGMFFIFSRNFKPINVALYGNCFVFNTNYNIERDRLGGRRVSSLTGPSFGLNLIVKLDQINYMKGGITKQVEYYSECNGGRNRTEFYIKQLKKHLFANVFVF